MSLSFSLRAWFWVLALALLVGGVAMRIDWLPLPAKIQSPVEEPWSLTAPPAFDPSRAAAALATSAMWGIVEKVVVEQQLTDPAWRITAALAVGKEKYLLISIDKQPNQQLRVGDSLPGGAKIIDITDSAACILVNGKKRSLSIHPTGPARL